MNKNLYRPQFEQMKATEKLALMQALAERYQMTFRSLYAFSRWGQSCTTGVFEKNGWEFVFVPGDTVTLGWEQFAVGLNQESREELEYLFQEKDGNDRNCPMVVAPERSIWPSESGMRVSWILTAGLTLRRRMTHWNES